MDVRLNPHCGVSGVPFMKSTTGAEATALSIALRTSSESSLVWEREEVIRGRRVLDVARGESAARAPRKAWLECGISLESLSVLRRVAYGCS